MEDGVLNRFTCKWTALLLSVLLIGCAGTKPVAKNEMTAAETVTSAPRSDSASDSTHTLTPEPTATTPEPTATPVPTPELTPTEIPMTPPIIQLKDGETITVDAAFTFIDPGYSASDYLGQDLTDRVIVSGEVISYLVGEYELTYTVEDDYDQTATITRKVNVQPVAMPEIVIPPEKTVYLTFDDGPAANTSVLLDVLAKYNAKATFFLVGNRIKDALVQRMVEEGHSVGVHTYTHEYHRIYASEKAFFEDFQKTQEVIYEKTGVSPRIFRFPGGSANTVSCFNGGIMTRLTGIMEDMGYRYFDWNVSAGDAQEKKYTPMEYYSFVMYGLLAHPDYAVVLQHDTNYQSLLAVELVLKWGMENGYTFRALDLTSPVVHSKVNN